MAMKNNSTDATWSLSIRYEGNDAENHQIDLSQLGVSLQGLARVLAVSAHFVQTWKYNKHYSSLSVQVLASPVQEHHCYEVLAVIRDVAGTLDLWSGSGGAVLGAVVAAILSRGRKQEMKLLNEALQALLAQNKAMQDRLLDTVGVLVAALQPSAKQVHAPVGASVESIAIRASGQEKPSVVLDRATKALVSAAPDTTIDETRRYTGVITELDMLSGACKVALDETTPEVRTPAVVIDPHVTRPNNPYVLAMADLAPIKFQAKAELDADGNIAKLHISDVA